MFPSISQKQSSLDLEIFDQWNVEKKKIQEKIISEKLLTEKEKLEQKVYINEREVWYATLGQNIGSESNGKKFFRRPILVVKKVGSMFFVAPMTTKGKDNIFHFEVTNVTYNSQEYANIPDVSRVQLSQCRILDASRFLERIATVGKTDFEKIKKNLRELLL